MPGWWAIKPPGKHITSRASTRGLWPRIWLKIRSRIWSHQPDIEDMGTLYIYIWLVVSTPLKNMKVSWDYCSQYMEKNVPNHQPVIFDIASHVFQPFSQPIILLTFWWHDDMIISLFFFPVFNPHLLPLKTASGFSAFTAMISPVVLRRAAKTQPTA